MSENLDRAQCERLRDMGMPQEGTGPYDLYYGDYGSNLYRPADLPSWIRHQRTYVKCPSNDDLEAFAMVKARRLYDQYVSLVVEIFTDGRADARIRDHRDSISCDYDPTGESTASKSLALYNLIEKLHAMIAKETD